MFVLDVLVARMSRLYYGLQFVIRAALFCLPFIRERNDVRLDVTFWREHIVVLVTVIRSAQTLYTRSGRKLKIK